MNENYYLRTILTVDGFDKINSQPIIPYDHNYEDAINTLTRFGNFSYKLKKLPNLRFLSKYKFFVCVHASIQGCYKSKEKSLINVWFGVDLSLSIGPVVTGFQIQSKLYVNI
uniref:Uncharacterized protein n=1 Tax=Glossina pallidipes TaxID=7398 RepID=A0A1B0AEC1_GLOPL